MRHSSKVTSSSTSISRLLSVIEIFRIASNVDGFCKWYQKTYSQSPDKSVLDGYKYFIEGCFHILFDQLAAEAFAGLVNDLTLNRAIYEWVSLEKLENTCEKVVLLKNIYSNVKPVKRSKSFYDLQLNLKQFDNNVIQPVGCMLHQNLYFQSNSGLTREEWMKISIITTLYLYFNQIANSSPVAHVSFLAGVIPSDEKKTTAAFQGYKYALQFVWYTVLGVKPYSKTSLVDLHNADSWKTYKYNTQPDHDSGGLELFNRTYELDEQTCLDSYFERIRQEIILPIERKRKVDIIRIDEDWRFLSTSGRRCLKSLLKADQLSNPLASLSVEDKIQTILYWYPLEVMGYEQHSSFNGISAFNTMLAGTVSLLKPSSHFKKCIVSKFKHLGEEGRNNYSYGILIDSKSAADHYMSGWIIYYDCCNDYSGFSSSEFKKAERLIQEFKR